MADALKVLGQSSPVANTLTDLYTVPALTQCAASTLMVCNRGAATTFRASIAPAGAADAVQQYQFFDTPLQVGETKGITVGFSLATTDKVRVSSVSGTVSFSIFGAEIT